MMEKHATITRERLTLRAYLLNNLSVRATRRVEARLARDPALREALDVERSALEQLDALGDVSPPPGLAERSAAAALEAPRPAQRRWLWQPLIASACVLTMVAILGTLAVGGRAREAARRASNPNNMKQFAVVAKMYASENDGFYPPLSPDRLLMADLGRLYPEFFADPTILVAASDDFREQGERMNELAHSDPPDVLGMERIAAESYVYLPWVVRDEEEFAAMLAALPALDPTDFDKDLQTSTGVLPRMREDIAERLSDEGDPRGLSGIAADLIIAFGRFAPVGRGQGVYVLHFDGSVMFTPFGNDFPATQRIWQLMDDYEKVRERK